MKDKNKLFFRVSEKTAGKTRKSVDARVFIGHSKLKNSLRQLSWVGVKLSHGDKVVFLTKHWIVVVLILHPNIHWH